MNSQVYPGELQEKSKQMEFVIKVLQQKAKFKQDEIEEFKEAISDTKLNRILGSIFGSMIGDALGSYCQFQKEIWPQQAKRLMSMPGGGTFRTILPGQYTDDNEMAYHLLQGLCNFDEKMNLSDQKQRIIRKIGQQYVKWVASSPFDIGNTCGAAIYVLRNHLQYLQVPSIQVKQQEMAQIYNQIYEENKSRQSNGSLMRITPMAAFMSLLQLDPIEEKDFIVDQIRLTHPNENLRLAGLSWVYLLNSVINRRGSHPEDFANIYQKLRNEPSFLELSNWFRQAEKDQDESMPAFQNMGWARIAWSYGLKFLLYLAKERLQFRDQDLYKQWIKWVILRAGDTDTNAGIAGGLIGAVIGFRRLPIQYLEKIFQLDYSKGKITNTSRGTEYQPSNFLREILKLIKKCKVYKQKTFKTSETL